MHDRVRMRRLALIPAFLALLAAFVMAPFQHIHLHPQHPTGHGSGEPNHPGREDGAIVHSHFYAVSLPVHSNGGQELEKSRDHHASLSLDTYRVVPQGGFSALLIPESRTLFLPPAKLIAGTVEVVETRGHDPPSLDLSPPRAPPV